MTMWVLRQALTPQEELNIDTRKDLVLPFDNLPDLTHVTTPQEAKRLLNILYPGDPPEAITRRFDRFWHQFTGLQIEDLIVVPLFASQQVALAEVTGHYHYQVGDQGGDIHLIPVRWYEKRISMRKLSKHKEIFSTMNPVLSEVAVPEIRIAIRDHLPHSYNRFAKWKWLLGLFFALGLVQMLMHWGR